MSRNTGIGSDQISVTHPCEEGKYLGSISTYYRVLRAAELIRERRRVATHPPTVKPELVATRPNEVWSWDITRLAEPAKWTWFYLYTILDIYSRYVVGWVLARRETAAIAEALISATLQREGIAPGGWLGGASSTSKGDPWRATKRRNYTHSWTWPGLLARQRFR